MTEFFKRILKLSLSTEDKEVLAALNASTVTSRKVVGRGTLTVNVSDITGSQKFKDYSEKAAAIVSSQR
jgi:hypothetical protein